MKLSEAIKLGIPLIPAQPRGGTFFTEDKHGKIIAACVAGTAIIGSIGSVPKNPWKQSQENNYENMEGANDEPALPEGIEIAEGHDYRCGSNVMITLYETYGWSREKIADYLESVGA